MEEEQIQEVGIMIARTVDTTFTTVWGLISIQVESAPTRQVEVVLSPALQDPERVALDFGHTL